MPLDSGSRLGHYEVLSPLGAGGMGEVYRARDTKLGREVAIKILPAEVADDDERLARFRREAQVLASLNHPHIAAIHGLEQDGERPFLVLELVEGETLAERIGRGAIAVDEAIALARQVVDALEQAHAKGIVHRDLKPANVKITPEGSIKVLDFGLAKALAGDIADGESAELSQSPTLARQTAAGLILGTAAYMSPEQARGKTVDKRADIWAFGVVLFEMLTGRPLFTGDTVSDVLAAVLRADIDWKQLPAETPSSLRRLLKRLLARAPNERLHDIADARLELDEKLVEEVSTHPRERRPSWVLAAALAMVAAIVSGVLISRVRPDPPREVTRFSLELPALASEIRASRLWIGRRRLFGTTVALSADGKDLVYVGAVNGTSMLFRRSMNRHDAVPIAGTEAAFEPFLSPDGKWVGFFSNSRIKKVPIEGGTPLTLSEKLVRHAGASWGNDGYIVVADVFDGLFRIPDSGGEPESLVDPSEGEFGTIQYPHVLPGDRAVLFGTRRDIRVYSFETGAQETLIDDGALPHYLPSGHLLFARVGTIYAVAFDADRLEVTGNPYPVVEGLSRSFINPAVFSVSKEGSLAYAASNGLEAPETSVVRVDREGNVEPLLEALSGYYLPRVSPDGERVVLGIFDRDTARRDIWVLEVRRGALTRITSGEMGGLDPIWSRDGKSVVYASPRGGVGLGIFSRSADGFGDEVELWKEGRGPNLIFPRFLTPDGELLGFHQISGSDMDDVGVIHVGTDAPPEMVLGAAYSELQPSLSPDGRWLAYVSDESGTREVYVRPFRGDDRKWRISIDGGDEPVWAPSGRELFYRSGERMMSVAVTTDPELRPEAPMLLFEGRFETDPFAQDGRNYDIFPDGESFLMLHTPPEARVDTRQLNIVLNWSVELERLSPTQ